MQEATLIRKEKIGQKVIRLMAQEFIEERLGMAAKPESVNIFAQQIARFIRQYGHDFNQSQRSS